MTMFAFIIFLIVGSVSVIHHTNVNQQIDFLIDNLIKQT